MLRTILPSILALSLLGSGSPLWAQERGKPDSPPGIAPSAENLNAQAEIPEDMATYKESIPGTLISFGMTPIPSGTFRMGSPPDEKDRKKEEGPVHNVEVDPFWMGTHEVTWDEYH